MVGTKEHWDRAALENPYGAILHGVTDPGEFWNRKEGIVHLGELTPDGIFLDLGCGIGRIARHISPRVGQYWGIDVSEHMIERARAEHVNYDNVSFVVGNGVDLGEFGSNTFDYVFTCLLFQHIFPLNTISYIKEVYRVLKEGGTFFCRSVPTKKYEDSGINRQELDEAISPYHIVSLEETEHYYNLLLRK